jgi:hypothetical protein
VGVTVAPGVEWCWWHLEALCGDSFDLSFGVDNCDQGGGELRCIERNLARALSVPTTT